MPPDLCPPALKPRARNKVCVASGGTKYLSFAAIELSSASCGASAACSSISTIQRHRLKCGAVKAAAIAKAAVATENRENSRCATAPMRLRLRALLHQRYTRGVSRGPRRYPIGSSSDDLASYIPNGTDKPRGATAKLEFAP